MHLSPTCTPAVSAPPTITRPIPLKADTGATSHFIRANDLGNLSFKSPNSAHPTITAVVPSGHLITSQGHVHLPVPTLPSHATIGHVMPQLASGSLLSIGKLCDARCTAIFDDTSVKIYQNRNVIIAPRAPPLLQGTRNTATNPLYTIHLPTQPDRPTIPTPPPQQSISERANATLHNPSIRNRVAFYHAALFSPTITTWLTAHKLKHLDSLPAITPKQITKYGPLSQATIQGHRHSHRSNIRSTKCAKTGPLPLTYAAAAANAAELQPDPIHLRTHNVYVSDIEITGRTFSDQTGRFICPSLSGNNYVFVLYDYDTNSIHPVAIPNRKKESLLTAMQLVTTKLRRRGHKPVLHTMDNEISDLLREHLQQDAINFELTPTGLHRRNLAERAIQTFKNHFIAGLCSTHPDFPLTLWDKLLPQCEITLNLLRSSRVNPNLSAYAQLHGPFNYNSTPLAPPGMKVLVHERPLDRGSTWSPHNTEAWYLGPAMNHYRQHRVFVPATGKERIADTVTWLPHNIHMPTATAEDIIIAAANDLTHALKQADRSPLLPPQNTQTRTALMQLQNIFSDRFAKPLTPLPSAILPLTARLPTTVTTAPLPRVTPSPDPIQPPSPLQMPAALPRVDKPSPPTTSADFQSLSTTLKAIRRKKAAITRKTNNPPLPLPVLSPRRSARTRRPTTRYLSEPTPSPASANAVLDPTTGKLLEYRDLLNTPDRQAWYDGCSKEFARLCNGRSKDSTKGTNSIRFTRPSALPPGKKATYLRICTNYRPQKLDPYRVRFTVGGNLVNYAGDTYTPTSDMTTAKILFNSVLSTPNAKFMTIDISNFYLITPIANPEDYEYMHIPTWVFPDDIKKEYNIPAIAENGKVLAEIVTGMYGLPQAGILAYQKLVGHLKKADFTPAPFTPGLFTHKTRPLAFSLVVDDFGVKYTRQCDVAFLISTLQQTYDITLDWDGKLFCGIHLDWDYTNRTVTCSMPGFVQKGLQRFHHTAPSRPQHSPHPWTPPSYGQRVQYAKTINSNPVLTNDQKKYCQQVIGYYLYYGRAIDNTILPAVGSIATALSTSSWPDLQSRLNHLLDYLATHPSAKIVYHASQMHLWVHTDSSYLNEPKARSRGAGFFFLTNKPSLPIKPDDPTPPLNGPILVNSKVIDAVMSSAQEAETGMGYLNAKDACEHRLTLEALGHPQGPTPLQFDNQSAVGILTETMTQRRSKAMDMRFYWLKDRNAQKQIAVHWKRAHLNLADYPSKHHPAKHHQEVRPTYVLNSIYQFSRNQIHRLQHFLRSRHCKGVLEPISVGTSYTDPVPQNPVSSPVTDRCKHNNDKTYLSAIAFIS